MQLRWTTEVERDILLYIPLVVSSLAERVAEPLKTLVKPITRGSAGRLNVLDA